MPSPDSPRTAILYRMVMPKHTCPYGLKAKALLQRQGYTVDDRHLETRAATDTFKAEHGVQTTPQAFINGQRIGGYDDLRRHFGLRVRQPGAPTYQPVIALFAVAFLMALALSWLGFHALVPVFVIEKFIAVAMCLLGLLKLQDVEKFSTMFLNYDLLARRQLWYGYAYPYLETLAGLLMLADLATWLAAPIALVIGGIGAVSVFKAVYLEKRELKCACVGGNTSVPLGFVSLTENLLMVAMALWMLLRPLLF